MKKNALLLAALLVLAIGLNTAVSAQVPVVERAAKGRAAQDVRVGIYVNVRPDCSSGTLPTIRLLEPPAHGKVTLKRGHVKATNYKQCLALEVPGYVAVYRSQRDFTGRDVMMLEVKYFGGRAEIQKITVTIGDEGAKERRT